MHNHKIIDFLDHYVTTPTAKLLLKLLIIFIFLFKILILLGKGIFQLMLLVWKFVKFLGRIKNVLFNFCRKVKRAFSKKDASKPSTTAV